MQQREQTYAFNNSTFFILQNYTTLKVLKPYIFQLVASIAKLHLLNINLISYLTSFNTDFFYSKLKKKITFNLYLTQLNKRCNQLAKHDIIRQICSNLFMLQSIIQPYTIAEKLSNIENRLRNIDFSIKLNDFSEREKYPKGMI